MEYIPSGMSKEQWKKMKEAEKNKNKGKNLGKTGITSFKSRSFADWQKSGGKNLFPVDPRSVKNAKDLPYMQRAGGSADDSDLSGKKKGGFSFNFGGKKKKEPEPEPEPEKKKMCVCECESKCVCVYVCVFFFFLRYVCIVKICPVWI
jgi:hypothetical protein